MSKFKEQVHISISSFSQNVIYYDLKLSQKMANHHHFSFVWQYTSKAVIAPSDQASAFGKYIGSEVIFTFTVNGIRLMSKGIITRLDSIDLHGSAAGLHVTGISHTVVLDDMKKSRIFRDKNLQEIVQDVFAEESSGEFYQREAILPTQSKSFAYKPQYNETNFDFIKRLSARYGQWFYFDGMRMQFGQTKTSKIKLINGASLHNFKIQTNLVSHKISFGGYDYNNATGIREAAEKSTTGSRDRFSSIVSYNQGSVARQGLNHGAFTNNAQNKDEIDEMVKLQTAGRNANSVFYSGTSYLPIGLGQVFTIQNQTVEHELVAIEIIHHSEVNGNYSCEFKAIPADVEAPHYTNVEVFAKAESQSARVKDNNDPEGMGRVKVEFYWTRWGETSDWMRIVQQYGGSSRGSYIIPEIGDEVQVSFDGENADSPYVSGVFYNGKEKSGYATENNDLKVMRTRSGIMIMYNDDERSLLIEDPSGNKYFMDGNGSIKLVAPKNIDIEAGEDIIMSAGQNIVTNAGMNISESAGGYKETTVGLYHNLSIGTNYVLNVIGNMLEWVGGKKEIESDDIKEMAQEVFLSSTEKSIDVRGAKNVNSHSGETSRNA
jgi:type VI secretion system secreted protein VgrG